MCWARKEKEKKTDLHFKRIKPPKKKNSEDVKLLSLINLSRV